MSEAKRRSVRIPKYRKHKTSGRAMVTLSGKDIYLGTYGTEASRQEYDRVVGEWQINGRILKALAESITVAELASQYLKFAATYYVKNGQITDEFDCVKSALKPLLARYRRTSVDEFGPIALESVRNGMIELGWSRSYVNTSIGRIKRMFKWGASKEIVPVTAYQSLATLAGLKSGKSNAKETGPVLPVPDEIVELTLKHAKPILAAMIQIQRLTGMRPGEVCALKPCDLDQSGDVWVFRPASHKMEHKGRGRVIAIGPKAQDILRPFLPSDPAGYCFCNARGRHVRRALYQRWIEKATIKAFPAPAELNDAEREQWIKDHAWAPNRLRHLAATEIRKQFGIELTRTVLGHSETATSEIYAEKDFESAAEVARSR